MISVSFHLFLKYLLWSEKGTISITPYSRQAKHWVNSVKLLVSYADQSKMDLQSRDGEGFPSLDLTVSQTGFTR